MELYGHLDIKGLMYSAKRAHIEKTKLLQGEETMRLLNLQMKKVILLLLDVLVYEVENTVVIPKRIYYYLFTEKFMGPLVLIFLLCTNICL